MKVTLSKNEILVMVCHRYNLPSDTVLEIVDNIALPDFIQKAINAVEFIGIRNDSKIACIKAFSEHTKAGLADSKGIIEQWDAFKKYAQKYGKLPENPLYNPIANQI